MTGQDTVGDFTDGQCPGVGDDARHRALFEAIDLRHTVSGNVQRTVRINEFVGRKATGNVRRAVRVIRHIGMQDGTGGHIDLAAIGDIPSGEFAVLRDEVAGIGNHRVFNPTDCGFH